MRAISALHPDGDEGYGFTKLREIGCEGGVGWVEGGAHTEKLVAGAPGGYYVLYHCLCCYSFSSSSFFIVCSDLRVFEIDCGGEIYFSFFFFRERS